MKTAHFLLGLALFLFSAVLGLTATNSTSTKLRCYQCTSINNTRCADPFTAFDSERECDTIGDEEAVLCRKLRQMIDTPVGKILRITRSCGYIRNENEEKDRSCFKASFSASTSSRYCACEDNKCNAGEIKLPSILLIVTSVVYALTMIVFIV